MTHGLPVAIGAFPEDEDDPEGEYRQLFASPSGELIEAIAQTLYIFACCFRQYGTPSSDEIGPVNTWEPIWMDPEEMLTIIGLFPFTTTEGVRYVIVDRQNENAWRGRDNKPTTLYHEVIDEDHANESLRRVLRRPRPPAEEPPPPMPPMPQVFTEGAFEPFYDPFLILRQDYPTLVVPKEMRRTDLMP
jgi:hypothetical protein